MPLLECGLRAEEKRKLVEQTLQRGMTPSSDLAYDSYMPRAGRRSRRRRSGSKLSRSQIGLQLIVPMWLRRNRGDIRLLAEMEAGAESQEKDA